MTDLQMMIREFCRAVRKWIPVRESTIQEILNMIEKLRMHHRNANTARVAGSATSIIGGAMAIAGLALAPVTFGVSMGLSAGGMALAAAGGTTAAGASIADIGIQKSNMMHTQQLLERDYKQLNEIYMIAEKIVSRIDDTRQHCPDVNAAKFDTAVGEILGLATLPDIKPIVFTSTTCTASCEVLIPIDLIEIVRSSVSFARGPPTKAIETLNEIVQQLQEQKNSIKKIAQV